MYIVRIQLGYLRLRSLEESFLLTSRGVNNPKRYVVHLGGSPLRYKCSEVLFLVAFEAPKRNVTIIICIWNVLAVM